VALAARRAGALSRSGALVATLVGAAAVGAGLSWAALLLGYFVSSVALTRFRGSIKAERTGGIVAKSGARDGLQVLANGGVFTLASLLWLSSGWDGWRALGAGSIAAAASDTWATEVGTLAGRAPRSIVSWREVAPGTSGGVTVPGIAAAVVGACFVALVALALRWPRDVVTAAAVGGIVGSTLDSVLGATLQARRWCDRCNGPTERATHVCGSATRVVGGIAWLDNDAVNVLCTAGGGLIALILAR
jgi:uncharacterized protein (TIGR00297 family)